MKTPTHGIFYYKNTLSLAVLILVLITSWVAYDNVRGRSAADGRTDAAVRALSSAQDSAKLAQVAAADAATQSRRNYTLLQDALHQVGQSNLLIIALRQQLMDNGITPVTVAYPDASASPRPRPGPTPTPGSSGRPHPHPSKTATPSPSPVVTCIRKPPIPTQCA